MILTQRYLVSDPPQDKEIESVREETKRVLLSFLDKIEGTPVVGTGGTVTTLAAMVHGIDVQGISPERMNGLLLRGKQLEELFDNMKHVPVSERAALPGLDQGRADVILAGSLVVTEILNFFRSSEMIVSLTDLLEGALLDLPGVSLGHEV